MRLNTFAIGLGIVATQLLGIVAAAAESAPQTVRQYLSGRGSDDGVPWQFRISAGMKAGQASTIAVPSCWELQGFGVYGYGKDKPPFPDEQGFYTHTFTVPAEWKQRTILLCFDGVMTDAEVAVNGKTAGPRHQGAFYPFKYDVTSLVKLGAENKLEVAVSKESADESVNRAERRGDYWNFGGIFRPVYLKAVPRQHIERVAIDARADGLLTAEVYLGGEGARGRVSAQILDAAGKPVGERFSSGDAAAGTPARLARKMANPKTWNAEEPNLYTLKVTLLDGEKPLHEVTERFGFRTVELKPGDGVYLNGKKIRFKGTCRHTFHPDTGRTSSRKLSEEDVRLLKGMNMNAVRMSHYPPDEHFLEVCDEQGLYVLDELAGWHQSYATEIGKKLVEALVCRDQNHPSILFWDNGNEGGWNTELDDEFAKWDLQKREVLHPWQKFRNTNTKHYPTYKQLQELLDGDTVCFPTEFLHGLYDGGHAAGMADYWNLMRSKPICAGGFTWALCDESVKRTDEGGRLDPRGNQAPDGILGPYREKEASYDGLRELWSPVRLPTKLPENWHWTIPIENDFDFTNTKDCHFGLSGMKIGDNQQMQSAGSIPVRSSDIPPGGRGAIHLSPPADTSGLDALALVVLDPAQKRIVERVWPIPEKSAKVMADRWVKPSGGAPRVTETDDGWQVRAGTIALWFAKRDGTMSGVQVGGKDLSLTGPTFSAGTLLPDGNKKYRVDQVAAGKPKSVKRINDDKRFALRAEYDGPLQFIEWSVTADGWVALDYVYELEGEYDYHGLTFRYPEEKVKSAEWVGSGPHRVWKNRLVGNQFGYFKKDYNDTRTGMDYIYPEFKGYYADVRWMRLATAEAPITLVLTDEDQYLHLFTPRIPADSMKARTVFPEGDMSVLHAIAPIGNKFSDAADTGPMGQKNVAHGVYKGRVYLRFGEPAK